MNTMNIPGFTAEASLYKTRGHYQTASHAITLPTQMIGAIYPTMENIEVHGCRPGFSLWEDAGDWGCIPDQMLGGGGPGPSDDGPSDGGPFGGGGAGKPPVKKRPTPGHLCGKADPIWGSDQFGECLNDPDKNNYLWCGPQNGLVRCCTKQSDGKTSCKRVNTTKGRKADTGPILVGGPILAI